MKNNTDICYWGRVSEIVISKYSKGISRFIFEKDKCPKELTGFAEENQVKHAFIETKSDLIEKVFSAPPPSLTIVCSFGIIVPPEIIEYLDRKIINIHSGILPYYRGRHPLPQAVLNRERQGGVSAHVMNEKIDAGRVVSQRRFPINYQESYRFNEKQMLSLILPVFDEVIEKFKSDEIDFSKKIVTGGRYYKPLEGRIIKLLLESEKLDTVLETISSSQ